MEVLTQIETSRLKECELIIATGLQTFVAVGNALLEISESKLYKNEFATFEEYCNSKWDIKKAYGYRLIQASKVMNNLSTMVDNPETLIDNPRKTTILAKFEPEIQKLIIQDLQENNITEITASFLEGFAKAYVLINSKVKEIKSTPLFSFNSESELIEKAKELIPPAPPVEPVVIETIKEVEVIKDQSLIIQIKENQSKINNLQSRIVQQSDSNADLQNKLDEYKNKVDSLDEKIKENETLKSKLTEYKDIQNALYTIKDLQAQKDSLFKESHKVQQILQAIHEGRKFFNQNIMSIGAIQLDDNVKENLQPQIIELLNIVDSWKYAITQNLLLSNNLLAV